MLYPKNKNKTISPELFRTPSAEYRGAPFWAWNCRLDKELLLKEIEYMRDMGMGGFHMHVRVGMSTEYLSDEYMQFVSDCVQKARKEGMLAWLYDEDKWPSGFAGGLVTKNLKYRQRYLLFTPKEQKDNAILLASYDVELDSEGYIKKYTKLQNGQKSENNLWRAYLKIAEPCAWFNNQTYVDTLNPEAIREFVRVTHERYKQVIGKDFGATVPAIFTDEPQVLRKGLPGFAHSNQEIALPFTDDFDDTYIKAYGESLFDKLPEVFWEIKGGVSAARYRYHDHCAERFVSAFADTVGGWCDKNGILLTGHMMEEPTLTSQTLAVGDAMRSYRSFGLPGVDMLCDWRELTTIKQAASAAHQYGRPGVLSELYGVTNWNFDFRGHKLQGDWQAALGVSVRVHHLYWAEMGGEAKRDYPASIGHQSPWHKEYPLIENHFARVNTLMTRGKPEIKIGVIHPVESYWLHCGPDEQTGDCRAEADAKFKEITEWLIYGAQDFDFIAESLLKEQFGGAVNGFNIGQMSYDAVVVPNCETLRASTLAALNEFADAGGAVIFAGAVPSLTDALPSYAGRKLAKKCKVISWSQNALLAELEPYRIIDIRKDSGSRASNLAYGLRADGAGKNLFVCHVNHPHNRDICHKEKYIISIKGGYVPVLYDTLSGDIMNLPAKYERGRTVIEWECYAHSSILLRFENGRAADYVIPAAEEKHIERAGAKLPDSVPVTLDEPNVLLLDAAEWSLDGGEWRGREEMLRLTKAARKALDFPDDAAGGCQPWAMKKDETPAHTVRLKYKFESEIEVKEARLALENLTFTSVTFNGTSVETKSAGKYVDNAIDTVVLPCIKKGVNELVLTVAFGRLTDLENCYILGDFGVELKGITAKIVPPVKELCFTDWTVQGLPFYGGNVIYHIPFNGDGGECTLKLGRFESPVITADMDGKRLGAIAFAPYTLPLGKVSGGKTLDLKVHGCRINTFGCLHNNDYKMPWFGPDAWRSRGDAWTYTYRLLPSGLLSEPKL